MRLGNDTITVIRANTIVDPRYGSRRRDWTDTTETTVVGVSVQPFRTTESTVDREYAATHLRVFAPAVPGITDAQATDRVRWGGVDYEIDGEPARWFGDGGSASHVELSIKRLTG